MTQEQVLVDLNLRDEGLHVIAFSGLYLNAGCCVSGFAVDLDHGDGLEAGVFFFHKFFPVGKKGILNSSGRTK